MVSSMSPLTHTESTRTTSGGTAGGRIVSGPLALVFLSSFGMLTSFYLLLSVTPMYAAAAGAGSAGAGLVPGVLLLGTVAAELAAPGLMKRYGYRTLLAVGAGLLGVPALALLSPGPLVTIVAVSVVRGLGFGLGTVVTGALVAMLLPPGRRGEGLGLSRVVACVPAVVAFPSGVWLAGHYGHAGGLGITGPTRPVPAAGSPGLPGAAGRQEEPGAGPRPPAGRLAGLRH